MGEKKKRGALRARRVKGRPRALKRNRRKGKTLWNRQKGKELTGTKERSKRAGGGGELVRGKGERKRDPSCPSEKA